MACKNRLGNYSIWGKAAPLLNSVFRESSKKVPNPNPMEVAEGRSTVYDTWAYRYPDPDFPTRPT